MTSKKELTGRPTVMKEVNISLITDALRTLGTASRVELSRYTKISQPTVNQLIRELVESDIVLSLGNADSTGGRKAEVFALNSKRSAIACITATMNGFVCRVTDMELREEFSLSLVHQENTSYTDELCLVIEQLLKRSGRIGALSIGLPGAVSKDGTVYAISQIPEWENLNLAAVLKKDFSLPISVINDINATTLGYMKMNGSDCQNLIYLQMSGTGLGAGIIINHALYPGFASFAGEAGYMQIGSGQSIESQLLHADEKEKALLLSRIIINMICVLNPDKIMIGYHKMTDPFLSVIRKACKDSLPPAVLPALSGIASFDEYYQAGLASSGLSLLDNSIHLLK